MIRIRAVLNPFSLLGVLIVIHTLFFSCATGRSLRHAKRLPTRMERGEAATSILRGIASYYGARFHGRKTANGEVFDMYAFTAAHKTLPFGTVLLVTNLNNGKKVTVRINDRGPFVRNRILDLSYAAAREIGMIDSGTAEIEARVIHQGN